MNEEETKNAMMTKLSTVYLAKLNEQVVALRAQLKP